MKTRVTKIMAWIITGLLSLAFLFSGIAKITGQEFYVTGFIRWGYPLFFMYVIGILQILGVVGLYLKKFRFWAALGLAGIMAGAVATHVVSQEAEVIIGPALLMVLSIALAWLRSTEVNFFRNKTISTT
ncbi:hypothetical protein BH23BAC1_BH23BAC1_28040 [soil metagenome]